MDSAQKHITEQRILSFCYGYGGLERGISKVIPIKPVAYVEIEAFQNFNLVAAMESGLVDKAPIWTNLKTFDAKPFHNKVHGIIGGYPCQGESLSGKRKLWNDDRFLWPYIEKAIIATNPFWCFFENVGGHLSGSFPYILESLRNLGYSVEIGLFTASEVGAPHKRERLFILALDDAANSRCFWEGQRAEIENRQSGSEKRRELQIRSKGSSDTSSKELGDSGMRNGRNVRRSKPSQKKFNVPSDNGKILPNTSSKRNGESSEEYEARKFIQDGNKWPVGPGKRQHEWESNRTTEPGVGCTVNGYNFRTELLRQYGNGVVSQTATKAFEMLLDKHLTNTVKQ